jgi:hypothetical protein
LATCGSDTNIDCVLQAQKPSCQLLGLIVMSH